MDAAPHHCSHAATADAGMLARTSACTGPHAPARDASSFPTAGSTSGRTPGAPLAPANPTLPTLSLDGLRSHGRETPEHVLKAMEARFPDGIACVPDTDGSVIAHCRLGSRERETVLRIQACLRPDFASARVERTVRARSANGHRVMVRLHGLAPGTTCHVRFLVLGALGWEASPAAIATAMTPTLRPDGTATHAATLSEPVDSAA